MDRYKIVRFYKKEGKRPRTMWQITGAGLTLDEARRHCSKPESKKAGVYFDGFTKM
jgi:hypothetical protein